MLTKRVIPCLDVRNGRLTKGVKFVGNEDIGDPVETCLLYTSNMRASGRPTLGPALRGP